MTVEINNAGALRAPGLINITEIDGLPLAANVSTIKFTNTSVTNYDPITGSVDVTTGVGGGGDTSSNTGVSVDGEAVLFSGTGGKTIKRSTLTGVLKSASGVLQAATPNTDYAPATTGTSILKALSGGFTNAAAGSDYLAPPSGTSILMANSGGALVDAVAGTHYLTPSGNGSQLTNMTKSQVGLSNVDNTSDANKPVSTAQQTTLAPKASPSFTGDIRALFLGNENLILDAKTNTRQITLGVFRIEHRAGIDGTRPITLDIDSNGYGNTRAMVINYLANGVGAGHESHLHEIIIDTDGSTGGNIQAMSVSKVGTGSVNVAALEALPDVHVLTQNTGVPINLTQSWKLSSAVYTDVTAAFTNGSNIELFTLDDDYVICGYDTQFGQIDIDLSIGASNTISAVFEYSTGVGTWATFTPSDGTNGFTKSGTIMWSSLVGWVAATVNGVSKFYIRIQRTRNALTTSPVEESIKISSTVNFGWDKNADVSVRKLKASGLPEYADRSAAQTGGLTTGQFYQTTAGVLMIV